MACRELLRTTVPPTVPARMPNYPPNATRDTPAPAPTLNRLLARPRWAIRIKADFKPPTVRRTVPDKFDDFTKANLYGGHGVALKPHSPMPVIDALS